MWRIDGPQGNEAAKIKWELPPYTRGRVLDIGCGPFKAFPHFIGVDNGHHDREFGWENKADLIMPGDKLDLIASASCDAVFSSHLLEHFPYEKVPAVLKEWTRVIKTGGHLILYVPDRSLYPNVGQPGANPDHRWDPEYESVVRAMDKVERGWDLVDYQLRDGDNEYSGFYVFRML